MKYQIIQGQEHKFAITSDITDEEEFLYPAFKQALDSLGKIIDNAERFDTTSEIELYGYSQNIITFSGVRGMGKTSAMVSFSQAMEAGRLPDGFKSCRFVVLPPVDPTIMEQHQNIVKLLLSRMYKLAENTWRKAERTHYRNVTDAKKNDLLLLFNECLSSLDAIKNTDTSSANNLSAISRISDSSILKQKLHNLVSELLAFTKQNDSRNDFLVIQLDDTDTSTSNCYEILEDLRKFLSIPNVIILMATDMKLLRTVILQHYVDEFASSRKEETISIAQLEKMESKYIDKIIPPTNAVHLPKLDECVVNYSDVLKLSYVDSSKAGNLLFDGQNDNTEQYLSAQELILRYIYRKTGIVFVASSTHYHNIIPTTLRGLSQFLAVLSSMEDIPPVADFDDQQKFRASLQNYIKVAEQNVNRFEKYFLNEWAEAKLTQKQAGLIANIANSDPKSRFRNIAEYVRSLYKSSTMDYESEEKNDDRKLLNNIKDYSSFINFLNSCENNYNQSTDVYFFFAIKTCLTILYHKTALFRMRRTVENSNEKKPIIFDFSPDKTLFPDVFIIPNDNEDEVNGKIIFYNVKDSDIMPDGEKELRPIFHNLFRKHYDCKGKSETCFALMNMLSLMLALGDDKLEGIINEPNQKSFFDVQMSALTISINLDLHHEIFNALKTLSRKGSRQALLETYFLLCEILDDHLGRVNRGNPNAPAMLNTSLIYLKKCIEEGPEKLDELVHALSLISKKLDKDKLEQKKTLDVMTDLYRKAKLSVKDLKAGKQTMAIANIERVLADASRLYKDVCPDKDLFDENFVTQCKNPEFVNESFMQIFGIRFKTLCKAYNVDSKRAKEAAKGSK